MQQPVESIVRGEKRRPMLKSMVARLAAIAGMRFEHLEHTSTLVSDTSTTVPNMLSRFATIPGMITLQEGLLLYSFAYAAGAEGDIVEIGSWQGRSTAFLAQACEDIGSGTVHAIDWFRGNPGKEHLFAVSGGAERALRANLERVGLASRVVVHADRSEHVNRDALGSLRMLFIDGEHTHQAVSADLEYAALLAPSGLLVLHDYTNAYPGVVTAAQAYLAKGGFSRPFQRRAMLIARRLA
jgi:predicted O-methyltransferase YrrM